MLKEVRPSNIKYLALEEACWNPSVDMINILGAVGESLEYLSIEGIRMHMPGGGETQIWLRLVC